MPEIGGVQYGDVAFEFMGKIAAERRPDGKLPGTLANEAAVIHEFHRQFPGVMMLPDEPSVVEETVERFAEADNTLVLDQTHRRGIERGKMAEAFVASLLGVALTASDCPYDMRAASGERLDVKATRRGLPLMIPYKQGYKIDEKRVDAFVLVWDGNELEVVGHAMTATFRSTFRRGGPPDFPIDTLYLPVAELHPLPREWYA